MLQFRSERISTGLDAFTDTQWVTVRGTLPQYPM